MADAGLLNAADFLHSEIVHASWQRRGVSFLQGVRKMRLTRAGEYAVRCVIYLAISGRDVLVSRKEIAEKAHIPAQFLAKIAQELAKAGLIDIRQGVRGGFILIKDPSEITLLDVVETMIGEIYLNDCVCRPGSCQASPTCSVHRVWEAARDQLRNTLNSVTFASLIDEGACFPPEPESR